MELITLQWKCILFVIYYLFCDVFALRINMDDAGLVDIPVDLNPSVNLLKLDDNAITAISETCLSRYTELQILYLRRNEISFIHHLAFVNNTKLKTVSLLGNTHLRPGQWFLPLRSTLYGLGVSNIVIETLEDIVIRDFVHLKHIYATVHCDQETVLNVTCLSSGLRTLSIREAGLTNISSVTHLRQLTKLSLVGNYLVTIPDLSNYPLEQMLLAGNQWRCDYNLCWLIQWNFFYSPIDIDGSFVCASPEALDGSEVMGVKPTTLGCYRGKLSVRSKFNRSNNLNW